MEHEEKPHHEKEVKNTEHHEHQHREDHEHHEAKKDSKKHVDMLHHHLPYALGILLILFIGYNLFQISSLNNLIEVKVAEAKEQAKPAMIQLYTITDATCKDCFDIVPLVTAVKDSHVNITASKTVDYQSEEGKNLVKQYDLKKIPTVIIQGETSKVTVANFAKIGDALVFSAATPPYTDPSTKTIQGRVTATIIKDGSCEKCADLSPILASLQQLGIVIVSKDELDRASSKGKSLIEKYDIKVLPTLLFSKDLEAYGNEVTANWFQVGTIEEDGTYITRTSSPPFINLTTNKIQGLVTMIKLLDKSCADCYDPDDFHKPILERMGVVFEQEKSVDISSAQGKDLIARYKIDKVPTIVLTGDVETYPVLVRAWQTVGTKETDGAYIFRKVEVARQTYKDLTTNKVVTPPLPTTTQE